MATSVPATTGPKPYAVTPAEKGVILDALDAHAKSYERAERAAKDKIVADAYASAAAGVRGLIARTTVGELEI